MEANNGDEMSSFHDLDETKAKGKLHAYYDKEEKAKSKIQKTLRGLFLIERLLRRKGNLQKLSNMNLLTLQCK